MKEYADVVLPILRSTRDMLMPHYGNIEHDKKNDSTPVTRLDLEVETYLRDSLAKKFLGVSFAGEEYGGSRQEERFWLCDPIDGTGNFIHGLPFCTVMLALIEAQRVAFSVIYDFINDTAYHATRDEGTWANDARVHVSERPLSHAYLFWEMRMDKPANRELYWRMYQKAGLIDSMSAGWEFAMVARGKSDGRVTFDGWGFDYDFAPGSLLVEEAGGIVANIGKRTYDYRNRDFLACNPAVFKELTEGPDAIFPIVD